jgi:hypothetical protein
MLPGVHKPVPKMAIKATVFLVGMFSWHRIGIGASKMITSHTKISTAWYNTI